MYTYKNFAILSKILNVFQYIDGLEAHLHLISHTDIQTYMILLDQTHIGR